MDQSSQRRAKPCWYKTVGLAAINDALLLESLIYQLLSKHFASEPCYIKLVDLFHSVTFRTEIGQLLDLTAIEEGSADKLARFTLDRYCQTIRNKTAYYSFVLPVQAALILTGLDDPVSMAEVEAIMAELGQFFQIQDDYLDVFGDPAVIGKIGTDIEEGKCTWLAIQCIQRANEEELETFKSSIGVVEHRSAVETLYREMGLDQVYEAYQNAFKKGFLEISVEELTNGKIKDIARIFASMVIGRRK
jgi:farnesyl diphosphate synthase